MSRWEKYGKTIVAIVAAVLTAIQAATVNGHITRLGVVQIAIAATTAVLVYIVPVVPEWPWSKSVIAGILSALNAVATLIVSGWGATTGTEIVLAILAAVFIRYAPAVSTIKPGGVAAE